MLLLLCLNYDSPINLDDGNESKRSYFEGKKSEKYETV
jgi:hypothetical protein